MPLYSAVLYDSELEWNKLSNGKEALIRFLVLITAAVSASKGQQRPWCYLVVDTFATGSANVSDNLHVEYT